MKMYEVEIHSDGAGIVSRFDNMEDALKVIASSFEFKFWHLFRRPEFRIECRTVEVAATYTEKLNASNKMWVDINYGEIREVLFGFIQFAYERQFGLTFEDIEKIDQYMKKIS